MYYEECLIDWIYTPYSLALALTRNVLGLNCGYNKYTIKTIAIIRNMPLNLTKEINLAYELARSAIIWYIFTYNSCWLKFNTYLVCLDY